VDSHQVRPGLYVGRTLLPAAHHDLKLRMVNTTAEPQTCSRLTSLKNPYSRMDDKAPAADAAL